MARKSARSRSTSFRGARSCSVTIIDSTVPSWDRMGVELTMVVTLRPSWALMTISSVRTVSSPLTIWATRNSRPSERRQVTFSSRSCGDWPGSHTPSTMRRALAVERHRRPGAGVERLPPPPGTCRSASPDRPGPAAPRGDSARWRWPSQAWEANSTSVFSSSRVNPPGPALFDRYRLPTRTLWRRMGTLRKLPSGPRGGPISGSPSASVWAQKSATRNGSDRLLM